EIDIEEGDVSLETEDRVTALVANLPIRRTKPLPQRESQPDEEASTETDPVWTASQA
ncbi:MAG: cell division topological specificity factor MinE, partial [Cyanobacteriota bacterium]